MNAIPVHLYAGELIFKIEGTDRNNPKNIIKNGKLLNTSRANFSIFF